MTQTMSTTMREERVKNPDGLNLFIRSWRPPGTVRGVVAIVPGFNSHGGYYTWTGEQLAARGFAAYAVDLRGRGQSDGERFYVEKFADYVSDVDTLVQLAKSRDAGLPFFLLGHSAGGVVACLYALDHSAELKGFVCISFAHEIPAPDFALAVFKGLGYVAPHAHILRLKNEDFSRDPKVVQAMNEDPLIANETQPTKTLAEMVRADELLRQSFPRITLPVLILHGTADHVTKPSGSQRFYDNAGSSDKTLKLYDAHYHDLLNDVDKETVMADILSWLDAHIQK